MTQNERRLTEVSPVMTIHEGDTREIEYPSVLVRTVRARMETAAKGLTARRVIASLADHLSLAPGMLAMPGETTADRKRDTIKSGTLGAPGRFVQADGVTVTEASFAVTCPGSDTAVYGSVTTWSGGSAGFLQCGVDPGKEPWIEEAYRLTCGPLDRREARP
ncbi:hypothetical protein AB0M19_28345 [Streptomyces sp. NPDC051920]|uniref:hypothetical protein n=1 Tax=Streptomyces sp. NPDC051920 TaxID=3155523 RepID=UPI00342D77BF